MSHNNPLPLKKRCYELLIDYLVIVAYLLIVAVVAISVYMILFRGIPVLSPLQSQLIATFTSVVPIVLWFSWLDATGGTYGKRLAGLTIVYTDSQWWRPLLRNILKFCPWQIGHMGVIMGVYTEFSDPTALILSGVSILLLVVMLIMGLGTKEKRHLGDYCAGSQVIMRR